MLLKEKCAGMRSVGNFDKHKRSELAEWANLDTEFCNWCKGVTLDGYLLLSLGNIHMSTFCSQVQDALNRLKNRLLNCIQYALSVEPESNPAAAPSPGWEGIHEDFLLLMGIQETDSVRAQDLLQELYNDVTSQIQSEIGIAWATIEDLGRERHKELIDYTNSHLVRLSHLIEAVISKELGIHLDPIDITFKPPTIDEFRDKLHELLNSGINKEVWRWKLYFMLRHAPLMHFILFSKYLVQTL